MARLLFILLMISATAFTAFSQSKQEQLEKDMEGIEQQFIDFFKELQTVQDDARILVDTMNFQAIGRSGWMIIDSDTINVGGFFRKIPENLRKLPEPFRPDEETLEGQEDISSEIPLLLEEMFQMFKGFSIDSIPKSFERLEPKSRKIPRDYKKPKKKKLKTITL